MTNYGLKLEDIEVTKEDYKFGFNLSRETLMPDGQWDEFLPVFEPQSSTYETYGCTVWGGQNQIETYMNRVFGFEPNYSERYNYILAKISPPGASPTDAYETFRKKGLINQEQLPYPNTYEEFLTPKPMDMKYIEEGEKWLQAYDFKHEWVRSNDMHAIVKHALRFSPIAISVSAWFEKDGVYVDMGTPNNHWCLAYGYEGDKIKVFDSYDHSKKLLSPDHTIKYAKRILITKRTGERKKNWWDCFNLFKTWKINQHT